MLSLSERMRDHDRALTMWMRLAYVLEECVPVLPTRFISTKAVVHRLKGITPIQMLGPFVEIRNVSSK